LKKNPVLVFVFSTLLLHAAALEASGSPKEGGTVMSFSIRTDAFSEKSAIPLEYSCDGNDLSPALFWDNHPPERTKSFALIVTDPDAPMGSFTHWVAYDIPASAKGLGKAVPTTAELKNGTKQGMNDFGKIGYKGPCPPKGHGKHRYFFTLKALDVKTLGLSAGSNKKDVEKATKGHVLAEAVVMGTYER